MYYNKVKKEFYFGIIPFFSELHDVISLSQWIAPAKLVFDA